MLALLLCAWLARRVTGPWVGVVRAVRDGIMSLRDHDFSVSVGASGDRELRELALAYNSLGDLLRRERLDLYQRELLLDTVIQTTPLSMVLSDRSGRVVYSNVAARQLLHAGRKLEGLDFEQVLAQAPLALREALGSGGDTLFTMEVGGRAAGLSPVAAQLPAERAPAPAGAAEAADARAGGPGGDGVEEGDPRHRARAQQLARADHVAGALRAAAGS